MVASAVQIAGEEASPSWKDGLPTENPCNLSVAQVQDSCSQYLPILQESLQGGVAEAWGNGPLLMSVAFSRC